jgi:hypothetical protein
MIIEMDMTDNRIGILKNVKENWILENISNAISAMLDKSKSVNSIKEYTEDLIFINISVNGLFDICTGVLLESSQKNLRSPALVTVRNEKRLSIMIHSEKKVMEFLERLFHQFVKSIEGSVMTSSGKLKMMRGRLI